MIPITGPKSLRSYCGMPSKGETPLALDHSKNMLRTDKRMKRMELGSPHTVVIFGQPYGAESFTENLCVLSTTYYLIILRALQLPEQPRLVHINPD